MRKEYRITIAVILAIFLILRLYISLDANRLDNFFWFCVMNLALLIVALVINNFFLISSVFVSSLILETLWIIDFVSYLVYDRLIFNLATYLFEIEGFATFVTIYHLLLLAVPLYFILEERQISRGSWILSSLFFLVTMLVSRIFFETNINCVYEKCSIGAFNFLYYFRLNFIPLLIYNWIVFTFLAFLPVYGLFRYWFNRKKK